jgi:hypothetical protein
MSKKKKRYGWVLQRGEEYALPSVPQQNQFAPSVLRYSPDVTTAFVARTRAIARQLILAYDEVPRKVELDENGKPIRVVPGR